MSYDADFEEDRGEQQYREQAQRQLDDEVEAEREAEAARLKARAVQPVDTRCQVCGAVAAENVCHLCKIPRASFAAIFGAEPHDYAERVRAYEDQGLTTSDAQAVVDAEIQQARS